MDEWQLASMQMDKYFYIIRQWTFYNSYKLLSWPNLQSVFSSLSEHSENVLNACLHFENYSPNGYPAGRVTSTLFNFLLVQLITNTVSSCLAIGSNHRSDSQWHDPITYMHKWLSQSHRLTLTLTLMWRKDNYLRHCHWYLLCIVSHNHSEITWTDQL